MQKAITARAQKEKRRAYLCRLLSMLLILMMFQMVQNEGEIGGGKTIAAPIADHTRVW